MVLERVNKWLWGIIFAVIAFFLVLKGMAVWAEGLWFISEGYGDVFIRILIWRFALFTLGSLWFFSLLFVPIWLAKRVAMHVPMPLREKLFEDMDKRLVDTLLDRWTLGICSALALIAGFIASNRWLDWLHFRYGVPFGVFDPIFGNDASFYVFRLPFLRFWVTFTLFGIGLGLLGMVLRLRYEELLRFEEGDLEAPAFAARPLLGVCFFLLLVLALGQLLGRYGILFARHKVFFGAGYREVYGTLWGYWVLFGMTLLSSLWCLWGMRSGTLKPLRKVMTALLLVWAVGRLAFPAALQALVVTPNELAKERRFLSYNIKMTRFAYRLDRIKERLHPAYPVPKLEELKAHRDVLANVRLWDIEPMLDVLMGLQALRPYYGFSGVDYDRYWIRGRLRQVAVATRELFLPQEFRTWVNEHLRYTHGYGVVMAPVTEFTEEGLPLFLIRDIPLRIDDEVPLRIRRPEIYFGEFTMPKERFRRRPFTPRRPSPEGETLTETPSPPEEKPEAPPEETPPEPTQPRPPTPPRRHSPRQFVPVAEYVLVRTKEPEFDYPLRQGWKETRYQADSGVPIGSWWRRFLFAARFMDLNILLTTALTRESRLLMYRRVLERVQKLAPFLLIDADPYPVITKDGRIVWLIDTYTATGFFPYSAPNPLEPRINYLRNAVKVVVDAYTGRTRFYVFDETDPLLRAYQRAFPNLFEPREAMPPDIKAHIRYPRALFLSQALLYCYYHMTDPTQFYNKEDVWEIAREHSPRQEGERPRLMRPYYIVMRPPGEDRDRFLLLLPFTPGKKLNMIAWMAAHCDPDRYGELMVLKFPRGRLVYGPQQVEARINTDAHISQQVTLWGQRGSRVIWGDLLVVPVGNSLLYVEPLYLQAEQTPLPELKRVIVVAHNQVVMGKSLWDALGQLFKTPILTPRLAGETYTDRADRQDKEKDYAAQMALWILRAKEARQKGDWGAFGDFLDKAFKAAEAYRAMKGR